MGSIYEQELRKIRETVPPVGVDSGGTVHAVKVDDQGRLLSNIIAGEVIARLGTLDVVRGGTLDQIKNVQVVQDLQSGTIDVAKTVQTIDELRSGTIDVAKVVQSVGELKSGTIDITKKVGGTVAQDIKVDSVGLAKASGVPVSATVAQDKVGLFRGGGTVAQVSTPRTASYGTLASAFPVDGAGQVPGTADVRTLDGFSLGMTTDGTVEVSHQLQMGVGGAFYEDGVGTLVTNEQRVTTINHKGLRYRPSLTNKDAAGTVSVDIDYMGN